MEKTDSIQKGAPKEDSMVTVFKVIGAIGGYIIGRYLGLIVLIIWFGAYIAGDWLTSWYLKKGRVNGALAKIILWSNLLAWFLPPLGIFITAASFKFSSLNNENSKKYLWLGGLCLVASLLNSVAGVFLNQ